MKRSILLPAVAFACALFVLALSGSTVGAAGTGLVAAYSFDEGSGTKVNDASGTGNNGTTSNTTWSAAGKYGGALSFNGTNARVNIPNSTSLQLSSAMTLEAWVNPSTVSKAWRDVVYKGNDTYYLMATSDSGAGVPAGGGTFGSNNVNAFGTAALTANSWTFLTATYDGTTLRTYVNGALVSSQAATGTIKSSTNQLQIGGDSIFGQYFRGLIDQVRVYNVALSQSAIQSDMTSPVTSGSTSDTTPPSAPGTLTASAIGASEVDLAWGVATDNVGVTGYRVERCQGAGCSSFAQVGTSTTASYQDLGLAASTSYSYRVRAVDAAGNLGAYSNIATVTTGSVGSSLVAAYSFDEGSGTAVGDASGKGNGGTVANATWSASGKYGGALSFNGTNARVNVPNSTSLQLSSAMTLEAWVDPTSVSAAWRDVVYKGNDNYYLMATTDHTGGIPAGGGTFGTKNANAFGTAALATNSWSFLAATYDGTTLRFYVNGALVASQAATGAITSSTSQLQIGGDSIYGQSFSGLIDQVRVYNTALPQTSIQSDMTTPIGSSGGDTTPPSTPTGLTVGTVGQTAIPVSWTASTDNVGVAGYRVFLNGSQVTTVSTTSYTFGSLTCGTSYTLGVAAVDAAGNVSGTASTVQQTAACTDTSPPSAPGTLSAAPVGATEIDLNWGASNDNVGVTGYRIERCVGTGCTTFAQIGTSSALGYQDTGLPSETTYTYRVRAVDAAGNLGPYSNTAVVTTGDSTDGLVAAYSFDEGSGTSVTDASGSGNTGTTVNTTWSASGKYGGALSFHGSNAHVDIADASSLRLSGAMTLEAWVNPATVSAAWRDVIYKGNDNYYLMATTDHGGGVPGAGGTFGGSNANAFGTSTLSLNTWSFLAVTYDGATIRFYVNGTLVASQAKTGAITPSANPLQIGGDNIFGQYFSGLIDQVRIYNAPLAVADIQADMATPIGSSGSNDTTPPSAPGTLTATTAGASEIDLSWGVATDNVGVAGYRIDRCQGSSCTDFSHLAQTSGSGTTYADTTSLAAGTTYRYQVRAVDAAGNLGPYSNAAVATTPTPPAGLVAAYSFDEGAGTTVSDSSGNGNSGTISGATWSTQGKFGSALSFNGSTSIVNVPNSSSLQLSTGMTLEAWVQPTTVSPAWRDVVYKGNDNYYLMGTTDHSSVPAGGGTFNTTNANVFGGSSLTTNTWTYIATTYDGANLRFYVNGSLVSTQAATGPITSSTNALQIGGDSIFGQHFAGLIDEVRVYSTALTASLIQADMSTAVAGAVPSIPANLTATVKSSTEVDLAWGAASDRAGVTGYEVERCQGAGCTNFARIATPSGTTYADTSASPNTTYLYRVRAVDANGQSGPYSDIVTAFTGLVVTPRQATLTPGQQTQYAASLPGGAGVSVTWSVDGVAGGSATLGTITSGGLYTAGSAAVAHTITATTTDQSQSGQATAYVTNYPGVFTMHNDNMRTGANTTESVLSPANVNVSSFGKLFSLPLDGIAYASPLYAENVSVPGQGTHNIVYVATEHDSVYAYDADGKSSTPLWKDSFIDAAHGITTVPAGDTGECCDIQPEIGITGTPVIDPSTNTLYVVAATKEVVGSTTSYPIRLHALDLSTGAEKFGGPVAIQASVPGTGQGASGGQVPFLGLRENQHTALLLSNGVVYFGFSSHGDYQPYHGWIFGYDAHTLQQKLAFNLTPNGEGAGVWMGGGGLATDTSGDIYYVSGDGTFDGTTEWGDSFVRMTPAGVVKDSFTPFNQAALDAANHDLGSGGALLLPDQPGAHPHEMVESGKDGTIYLVDRDNMGKYNTSTNKDVQTLANVFPPTGSSGSEPGNFSSPVVFGNTVFFAPNGDNVQGFTLTNGLLSSSAALRSAALFPDRGAALAASGSGTSNGILWVTQRNGSSAPGALFAFDLAGSGNGTLKEIWNSNDAGARDQIGVTAKFSSPLVANGKVFVAGETQLTGFGLLP